MSAADMLTLVTGHAKHIGLACHWAQCKWGQHQPSRAADTLCLGSQQERKWAHHCTEPLSIAAAGALAAALPQGQ